jgi:Gpi18-like mannosyltransferase
MNFTSFMQNYLQIRYDLPDKKTLDVIISPVAEKSLGKLGKLSHWTPPAAWRYALLLFLVLRLSLSVWMWGVRQVFHQPISPDPVLRPYFDVKIETNPWLEPWQRWDAIHYQAIAEQGYLAFGGAVFTPPLYPLLVYLLTTLSGSGSLLAGILVSNLAFLVCLAAFYNLIEQETGDSRLARRGLLYLASFPTAFFFLAGYTESLYLLAAVLSLYWVQRQKWIRGGVWGAIAALTRLTGALMIVPLAYAAWQRTREKPALRPWLAPAITLAGVVIFPLYVWLFLGYSPCEPWIVQAARSQGGLAFPGYSLFLTLKSIVSGNFVLADLFDACFLILFLATLPAIFRRLPLIYGIYQAVYLGLYISRVSHMQTLLSTARYVLVLFPTFIILAIWGQKPWVNRVFLYLSWLGLLLLSGQFAIWGWVG